MQAFADLLRELDTETGTRAKISTLTAFLQQQPPGDGAWAAALLAGGRQRRFCTSTWLRACLRRHCTLPEWLLADAQAQVGDTAETITLLLAAGHLAPDMSVKHLPDDSTNLEDISLQNSLQHSLQEWCEHILPAWRQSDEHHKDRLLLTWWSQLADQPQLLYTLNKLLTGGFRIGIAKTTVGKALAAAADVPLDVVTEAMVGGFEPHPAWQERLRANASTRGTRPYPFYLASPIPENEAAETLEPLDQWHAEWKWDGIRAQLIRRHGEVAIWSRGEEMISAQFLKLLLRFKPYRLMSCSMRNSSRGILQTSGLHHFIACNVALVAKQ